MIHLITGTPGAGKTLRAVYHILEQSKKGRLIYTNIDGLEIPGTHQAPDIWTETPEGSLVVYDEAQQIFPPDGKTGRSNREDMAAMELHRHTGHDLILITQHPNLIHSHVRRLVGKHEHLNRAFGWNKAQIYLKDQVMRPESKGDLQAAEKTFWDHDKKLFQYYKSASLHVEHKRIPKPIMYAAAAMIMMVIGVFYLYSNLNLGVFQGKVTTPETVNKSNDLLQYPDPNHSMKQAKNFYVGNEPPKIAMSGCIASASYCRCYTDDYEPIFMDQIACYKQMEIPIPRKIQVDKSKGHQSVTPSEFKQTT